MFSSLGGFIVWVHHAFGPFWAFQEGYWSWIANVVSAASFPVMLINSIELCFDVKLSAGAAYFLQVCFVLCCCLPLLLGAKQAGHTMLLLFSVAIFPFIIFSGMALENPGPFGWGVLGQVRESDDTTSNYYETLSESSTSSISVIAWKDLLTIVFWNVCNGFTNVSTFAGEVRNPSTTYPKALSLAVIAIIFTYVIPLSAAAVYNEPIWATWDIGSFTEIARSLGGIHLLVAIFIASTASNAGLITAYVFSCTFQLTGMGEADLINSVFTKRTKQTFAPWVSWLCSIIPISMLMALELDTLLVVTNALSALSQVLLVAAAIRLRVTHPEVPRPYCVPGNVTALVALGTPPVVICGWMIYSVCASDEWVPPILTLALVLLGSLFAAFTIRRKRATST
jgi:amino acid transporter